MTCSHCDNTFWWVNLGPQWLEFRGESFKYFKDLVFVIAWFLWYMRNSVLHDSNSWNASYIIDKAKMLLAEFYEATEVYISSPPAFISKWEAPNGNYFKINFNAAVSAGSNFFGIGVVIRNSRGEFFAGFSKKCRGCLDVFGAKLTAACEALRIVIEVGFRGEIELEGDNLAVVNALVSEDEDLAVGESY